MTVRSTDGSARAISAEARQHVVTFAAVEIAVGGNQDAWLDLTEPIEHALHAEVRRARRPDRADRGRAERRDDRLGQVRHVSGDPVARADSASGGAPSQIARPAAYSSCVAQLSPAAFAVEDDRRPTVAPAQQVLGEVEASRLERIARRASCRGRRRRASPISPRIPQNVQTSRQKSSGDRSRSDRESS